MVFKTTIIATTVAGLMALCNLQLAVAEPVKARALAERAAPRPNYYDLYANEPEEDDDFELVDEDDTVLDSRSLDKRDSFLTKRNASCSKTYKVKDVDNCIKVAKKFGLSLTEFYALNPSVNKHCSNLLTGKSYCVAKSAPAVTCTAEHSVSGSDNCISVAKKYGITLSEFYEWNPKVHRGTCDNLDNGKKYCVAVSGSSKAVQAFGIVSKPTSSKKSRHAQHTRAKKVAKVTPTTTTEEAKPTVASHDNSGLLGSKKTVQHSKEQRKLLQKSSAFTYYWIAHSKDYSGGKMVEVKTCAGKTIAKVQQSYADALVMEGTGQVGNKVINLGGCSCNGYKCFEVLDKSSDPYGLTAYDTALRPYITIASNDLPKHSKIYVPSLVGWKLPGAKYPHNGCLLVDDQSWSFNGRHIDFYVYSMDNYNTLNHANPLTKVDIYEGGSCKLLNYV
ncbi:hypothetical protein K450DRAFT_282441 [Umbelopsis ramanniana AG]|uniref:LysM domain-containing protein n=1 Tax=Umbelopsis ramanniana AG TaxID=1314678 RepID=A0AAD5HB19_UMBRA|nr:uncharacterized protein K450DRAFT_282441 [Umbelopsis ramanniana AG]KAI8577665.1 hypothetical protein K450DRAFT_282441 [Umbelopsis ramanniana AG]